MGHVICSVKTGPKQSIVKLNLFNYFEKKQTHPRHRRCFLNPNRFNQINNNKVSHKPCSCSSFKILYILLGRKPVHHLGRVLF
jgi:hypothetical protein